MRLFCSSSGSGNIRAQAEPMSRTAASDTPMTNRDITSEQSLGFLFLRLDRYADIALAVASQKAIRVDAGVVPVAPCELQRIAAHRLGIVQANQHRDVVRLETQFAGPFI